MTAIYVVGLGHQEARATIDVRVIDVTTSEVVYAFSETGTAANDTTAILIQGFAAAETEFGGLEARAIADAVNRIAHNIRRDIGGEDSYVTSKTGNDVVINVGSSIGVQPGATYLVYSDGGVETDLDGRVLGRNKIPLAVVKVTDVQPYFSTCAVAAPSKSAVIERGDKIEPIALSKSKTMKFPDKRPVASNHDSEAMRWLMGERKPGAPQPAVSPNPAPAATPAPAAASTAKPAAPATLAPAPVASPAPVTPPAAPSVATPKPAGNFQWREIEGFDCNSSTDAKVIDTFPLTPRERNTIGIAHRGAYNTYAKGRYKDAFEIFAKLATDYDCNYLSSYWAGVCATKLRSTKEAAKWFERALSINPDYKPAREWLDKLGTSRANRN
jgi:TolA-binding protein